MTLGLLLRLARQAKGFSQLDLSLTLGVSQRHISFLESNRAQPSRELILAWMEVAEASTEVRNAALYHAGFSCEARDVTPTGPSLESTSHEVELLKSSAIAFPLLLFNANWQLFGINAAAEWLASETMPTYWKQFGKHCAGLSMVDAFIDPDGLLLHVENAAEGGLLFLTQIERESWTNHGLIPATERLSNYLSQRYGVRAGNTSTDSPNAPLKLVFETRFGLLSFLPVQSTLGHSQEITLESLRIAHLFPGDEHTHTVLRAHV